MKYPEDMDMECVTLCDALNEFKKTETMESCCGHLRAPFRIWFRCSSFTELAIISRAVDRRYAGTSQLWHVVSDNSDTHPRFGFMLESENRYTSTLEMQKDSDKIADNIRYWRDNFMEYFRSNGEVTTKSRKKDLALTWQDIAKIDDMLREVQNCIATSDLPTMGREEYYTEVLNRYNELKK